MELELGVELLVRSPAGVRATEDGETLLRHARLILGQLQAAREAIQGSHNEPSGDVRFGMPGTIAERLCLPLILSARERYPKVKLRVAEAMSGFVLDWLRDGKIDLGVLYRSVDDRGLVAQKILAEELCLIGPPDADLPVRHRPGRCRSRRSPSCRSSCRAPRTACATSSTSAPPPTASPSRRWSTSTPMPRSSSWSRAASATRSCRSPPCVPRSRPGGSGRGRPGCRC